MQPFAYARPSSIAEAVEILGANPEARPLAGGTDLTVGLRHGRILPPLVVDLKHLVDLRPAIESDNSQVRVSATAQLTDLAAHGQVRKHFPALAEAAAVVGSIQIRNRATLAGNICNASPAADTVPALAAYGAAVVVGGPRGERQLPVADFILGNRRTALAPGEFVVAVALPIPGKPVGASFARMTRRRGVDLATINLCCRVDNDGGVTYAYGAVSPKPLIVAEPGVLTDPRSTAGQKEAALDALVAHARPITDVRASAEYRLAMVKVLSRRALGTAMQRLKEQEEN